MENLILQEIKRDKGGRIIWSQDQLDYIVNSYNKYHSTPLIAKFFGINRETIRTVLRKQGVKILSLHELQLIKNPRNSNFFEKIDTSQKAYWLGFLYADGNLSTDNVINITLQRNDKEHLEKFKKAIEAPNHEIHDIVIHNSDKEYLASRFWIGDKKMGQDLQNKGCIPNKSLVLKFPYEHLTEDLYSHFIRGYIDGDGYIGWNPGYLAHNAFRLNLIGTKDMLNSIKDILGKPNISLSNKGQNFTFSIGGNRQLVGILNYIYHDSYDDIELTRKREKYNEFLNYMENK